MLSGQDILHVYQGASGWKSAWKTAYKRLALRIHPDKISEDVDVESAKMAWNHLLRLREEGERVEADVIPGRPGLPAFSLATENKNLQVRTAAHSCRARTLAHARTHTHTHAHAHTHTHTHIHTHTHTQYLALVPGNGQYLALTYVYT